MRSTHRFPAPAVAARRRTAPSLARWILTTAVLAGCGGLEPVAPYSPITDPAKLFMSLSIDHGAVNLSTAAPYDQLQLTATPRASGGVPMTGLAAPTFRSSDTTKVWVSPDGLLQARDAATDIQVIAELTADGNIRHADTALVNVTADPAPQMLDVFSLEPGNAEGAVWPMISLQSIFGQILFTMATGQSFQPAYSVRALDASGNAIPDLRIEYESLDPDTALVHPVFGHITLSQPGTARIVARTTAYGVSRADTTVFTVTLPVINGVLIQPGRRGAPATAQPSTLTVRPGGYVTWPNLTQDSVSITFDDPTGATAIEEYCTAFGGEHCEGGDISNYMSVSPFALVDRSTRGRQFLEPGTFTWRIEPLGITGRVIVTETVP